MEPSGWDWPAVAALATAAAAVVTVAYAIATCFFVRSSFGKMNRAFDERAADRERAWAALEAEQRHHDEAIAALAAPTE